MPGSDPAPTPPRPGRGLRLALIASLALNLLFLGLLAGGLMIDPQRHAQTVAGPDLRALWRALPDESRQALRAEFRERAGERERPDRGARRERLSESEAELLALLRAESFDAAAFSALLESRRKAMTERAEAAQSLFVARLAALDAAERAAVADRYEETRRTRRATPR